MRLVPVPAPSPKAEQSASFLNLFVVVLLPLKFRRRHHVPDKHGRDDVR
jgi:hypothetical protein